MHTKNNYLIIRQLDTKLQAFSNASIIQVPSGGWVNAIRKALNMSLAQLGKLLSVTPQGIKDLESRETKGALTINTYKQVGEALNLKFVYGFIPQDGSLEKMIERKAIEMATKIVTRTSVTMSLEDQENSKERLKQAIKELAEDLKREMPKSLWD